ncbi:hypothetical protein [Roseibium aggregatum]|uniref:hypothetical protein n=1 Tax=Roseibium aggregatum TaxID=187304 RepID=UPI001E45359D|nr:hypothetical protein [Roseibium aggregatum]UES39342.1 hypothetical protein GFC08_16615 [Roseibium aggregatum]
MANPFSDSALIDPNLVATKFKEADLMTLALWQGFTSFFSAIANIAVAKHLQTGEALPQVLDDLSIEIGVLRAVIADEARKRDDDPLRDQIIAAAMTDLDPQTLAWIKEDEAGHA